MTLPAERRAELMAELEAQRRDRPRWLVDEEGFRLVEADWPSLRLESPRVRLDVGFGAVHGPGHGHP